jgi:hydroxyethylthiazole kinase-like uncharacterized protein yjeF
MGKAAGQSHVSVIRRHGSEFKHDAQRTGKMKTVTPLAPAEPLTAEQMRKIEADSIASGQVTGEELMERAGQAVVAAMQARWKDELGHVVVLCGPGNNGGDGYVIARLLADRGRVSVFALGDPDRLPPDARTNYERWRQIGPVSQLAGAGDALPGADTVVDALFGIGLARPLSDVIGALFDLIPPSAHRVAVDVPSGWDADAATPLGAHVFPAELTVTFHGPKRVHSELVRMGQEVIVAGIGL